MSTNANANELATSRILHASPEQVFETFSNPELLTLWWGPNGFASVFEVFDFRAGGDWKFMFHGPNGVQFPNELRFVEIARPERLVVRHESQPHFTATFLLEAVDGGTKITFRQQFENERDYEAIKPIAEGANEQNLDRLEAVLYQG
ncbi:SRPBCC domain-containing protein [Cohnella yongneupensis]|uniref:SRPBCC domain-containing protein n=1 Tax=Cohnella yongneupensis TaxID=425006 RepID=A0ABW0R2X9_9BACL